MADTTTYNGDNAFLVLETPRRRSGERPDIDTLRQRVRDLGLDLRRNWNEPQPEVFAQDPPSRPPAPAPRAPEPSWTPRVAILAPQPRAPWITPDEIESARAFARHAAGALLRFLSARRGLALKGALGGLLVLATAGLLRDWPAPVDAPAVPPAPPVAWIDIAKPYPLFELFAPGLGQVQPLYAARRHVQGGGREDVLTFGQFGGPKPFVRIGVYRHGAEEMVDAAYFVDLARRASAAGLGVTQADLPQALPTRFGDFESGGVALSGPENVTRGNCRGFRLEVASPALTMGGLMCGAGDDKIGAADLACVIDRLDLIAAGEDRELADFFGAAGGRKSRACADSARRK